MHIENRKTMGVSVPMNLPSTDTEFEEVTGQKPLKVANDQLVWSTINAAFRKTFCKMLVEAGVPRPTKSGPKDKDGKPTEIVMDEGKYGKLALAQLGFPEYNRIAQEAAAKMEVNYAVGTRNTGPKAEHRNKAASLLISLNQGTASAETILGGFSALGVDLATCGELPWEAAVAGDKAASETLVDTFAVGFFTYDKLLEASRKASLNALGI
ncbi:MAG: hypothetical protein VXB01_06275 [Opitutae bacterium]